MGLVTTVTRGWPPLGERLNITYRSKLNSDSADLAATAGAA
jgi:hypothetical protein